MAEELHRLYLAKGILATTAIEGNTLTEEEVLQFLDGKLTLSQSREYLKQEIDNIVQGCNRILDQLTKGVSTNLNAEHIRSFNRIVLDGLTLPAEVVPGRFRKHSVGVARYKAPAAEDCDHLMGRYCAWLNGPEFKATQGQEILVSILKAALAHLYLAWIHPFGDGNGRTARLLELQILTGAGVPAPAAHLLSNHYNQTRAEYYRQLDQASRSGGDPLPFIEYAVRGLAEGLDAQLKKIRDQQWDVAWRNYVHERFADQKSPNALRRRHLALDLSLQEKPVPMATLTQVSPRIAAAYARKTRKTLSRDLNALLKMDLIVKEESGYRARRELILAFLPVQVVPAPPPRGLA